MIVRVSIPHPPTEVRLQGEGALQVLEQLRRVYPTLVVGMDDSIQEEASAELLDITQTDWYQTRRAQLTPGRCLRIYRENAGLSLLRLAELSGIEKRQLSQMEQGQRPMGEATCRELARHLLCDYRSLL